MDFEFAPNKSATNAAKHGIDFVQAQELWLDSKRIEIPARTEDEPRWMAIGCIRGKHWSAVFTRRAGVLRIISVRRSRAEEVAIYESE